MFTKAISANMGLDLMFFFGNYPVDLDFAEIIEISACSSAADADPWTKRKT
jgi:hypothetical protein